MLSRPPAPGLLSVALLLLAVTSPVAAQSVLYAENGDTFSPVRAAYHRQPLIADGDKMVFPRGTKLALKPVSEYAPFFISVRNIRAGSSALNAQGTRINNAFKFHADFVSPYPLTHVFLLLDLSSEEAGKIYFVWGLDDLVPNESQTVDLRLPLSVPIGAGKYKLHLYSDGREVFHSLMPFDRIERSLDKMVRTRIAGVTNAEPQPFLGPSPEYPRKLRGKHVGGKAVLSFEVSPNGRVIDPVVASATDPAFGDASLAAIRQWRFLPKVVSGRPVAASVKMPFEFPAE
ncbi:MAG TPA: energy transducer TonB [Opitutaceae bacterium]|nr:energy transducer TonB [Opitutaceae bacterium]